MFNEDGSRSRSHGLRPEIVAAQAAALGLPLICGQATWQSYEAEFQGLLLKALDMGVSHVIFGDIFPEAHIEWAEGISKAVGLTAVEPLRGEPTQHLATEFVNWGGKATILSVRSNKLDDHWVGRPFDSNAIQELTNLGVDPCGENGEFHTIVTFCPLFRGELRLILLGTMTYSGCKFIDLTV
jgi:uncharacterized protein (TIGR00290 family)